MKSILYITHSFPPVNSSSAIAAWRRVVSLSEKFDVFVLTRKTSNDDKFSDELPDNVEVRRAYDQSIYASSFFKPYWLPDALRKTRMIISEEEIDLIWSFFSPIATHLIALFVKYRHDIPWVATFTDPWVDNPYFSDRWDTSRKVERAIVNNADKIVLTTQRQWMIYKSQYSLNNQDGDIIPNFVDPHEIRDIDPVNRSSSEIRFVYMGNLYSSRSPEYLFKSLSEIHDRWGDQIVFEFIGQNFITKNLFDRLDSVVRKGRMEKEAAIAHAKASDYLLLIDAPIKQSPFLPMKLVEYLFMDKPILGLTPSDGTSAEVINNTQTGIVAPPNKPKQIADSIVTICKMDYEFEINEQERRKYTSEYATKKMRDIVCSLVE